MYRYFTRSLLKPLNLQAALYALIGQLTLVYNMQLNVLDDLAEAMKALDGKRMEKAWFSQIHLFHSSAALVTMRLSEEVHYKYHPCLMFEGTCCRVDGAEGFLAAALAALWMSSVVTSGVVDHAPKLGPYM